MEERPVLQVQCRLSPCTPSSNLLQQVFGTTSCLFPHLVDVGLYYGGELEDESDPWQGPRSSYSSRVGLCLYHPGHLRGNIGSSTGQDCRGVEDRILVNRSFPFSLWEGYGTNEVTEVGRCYLSYPLFLLCRSKSFYRYC